MLKPSAFWNRLINKIRFLSVPRRLKMKKLLFSALFVSLAMAGTAKAAVFVNADVCPVPGVRLVLQNRPVVTEVVANPYRRVVWMRDYYRHRIIHPYYDRWDRCYRY